MSIYFTKNEISDIVHDKIKKSITENFKRWRFERNSFYKNIKYFFDAFWKDIHTCIFSNNGENNKLGYKQTLKNKMNEIKEAFKNKGIFDKIVKKYEEEKSDQIYINHESKVEKFEFYKEAIFDSEIFQKFLEKNVDVDDKYVYKFYSDIARIYAEKYIPDFLQNNVDNNRNNSNLCLFNTEKIENVFENPLWFIEKLKYNEFEQSIQKKVYLIIFYLKFFNFYKNKYEFEKDPELLNKRRYLIFNEFHKNGKNLFKSFLFQKPEFDFDEKNNLSYFKCKIDIQKNRISLLRKFRIEFEKYKDFEESLNDEILKKFIFKIDFLQKNLPEYDTNFSFNNFKRILYFLSIKLEITQNCDNPELENKIQNYKNLYFGKSLENKYNNSRELEKNVILHPLEYIILNLEKNIGNFAHTEPAAPLNNQSLNQSFFQINNVKAIDNPGKFQSINNKLNQENFQIVNNENDNNNLKFDYNKNNNISIYNKCTDGYKVGNNNNISDGFNLLNDNSSNVSFDNKPNEIINANMEPKIKNDEFYLTKDSSDINSEMEFERLGYKQYPKRSFIRYVKKILNMMTKAESIPNNNLDENLIASEEELKRKIYQYFNINSDKICSKLKSRFNFQINKNNNNKFPKELECFIIDFKQKNYDSAIGFLNQIIRIYEPININLLKFLVSKTEEAAEKIRDKDIILLLGQTGSGKSTITLFLSGIQLIKNERGALDPIDKNYSNKELHKVNPSEKMRSETRFLTAIENRKTLLNNQDFPTDFYIVCDSPGLEENRNIESEISNNKGIHYGISNCERIRPIIIFTLKFDDRKQNFITLIKTIMRMLKQPKDIYMKFSYYVNKCTAQELEDFKKYLKNLSKNVKDNLPDEDKNDENFISFIKRFINHLSTSVERIDPIEHDFKEIVSNIFENEDRKIESPSDVFSLIYSEKMERKIIDFFNVSIDSIKNSLDCLILQDNFNKNENVIGNIEEQINLDKEEEIKIEFNINMIEFNLNRIDDFCKIVGKEKFEKQIKNVDFLIKKYLNENYEKVKEIFEKSIKEQNELTKEEMEKFVKYYRISSNFEKIREKFLNEECIVLHAYINILNEYFLDLIKEIKLGNIEEILTTNEKFKKAKLIFTYHPDNKVEKQELFWKDKYFNKIVLLIHKIKEMQSNLEIYYKEEKYEDLYETLLKINEINFLLKDQNSGFFYAKEFLNKYVQKEKFKKIHKIEIEEKIKDNLILYSIDLINIINFIPKLQYSSFVSDELKKIKENIIDCFELKDPIIKFEDNHIESIKNNFNKFEKIIKGKLNNLIPPDFPKKCDDEIKNKINQYLEDIYIIIVELLKDDNIKSSKEIENKNSSEFSNSIILSKNHSDEMSNSSLILQKLHSKSNSMNWKNSDSTINKLTVLSDIFHNLSQIKKIDEISNKSYKQIELCESCVKKYLNKIENNVFKLNENILKNFYKPNDLNKICLQLKKDLKKISESEYLITLEESFLNDLRTNFATKIKNFLIENDYFQINDLSEGCFENEEGTRNIIYCAISLTSLYNLKDDFPEFECFNETLTVYNNIINRILNNIQEIYSKKEENLLKWNLKKNKVRNCLKICELFKKSYLNNRNDDQYKKFAEVEDKLLTFLTSYGEDIINHIEFIIKEILIDSDIYNKFPKEDFQKNLERADEALNEYKSIEKYENLYKIMFDDDKVDNLWRSIDDLLNRKIAYLIQTDLDDGINISNNKLDLIPKILRKLEKFYYFRNLGDSYKRLLDNHSNLLKEIIPNEISNGRSKINNKKFNEVFSIFDQLKKDITQTKNNIFNELQRYLSENIQDLLIANSKIIQKIKNYDIETCEPILDLAQNLKYYKEIKDNQEKILSNNYLSEEFINKINSQYNRTLEELSNFFNNLVSAIKKDIEYCNFKNYIDRKELMKRSLNELTEFIEKGSSLDVDFINEIKSYFEEKIDKIISEYNSSFDNYMKIPPKNILENLHKLSKDTFIHDKIDQITNQISNNLNSSLELINKSTIVEKEQKINKIKTLYIKFLPPSLEEEFKEKCQKIEDEIKLEKEQQFQSLDEIINNHEIDKLDSFCEKINNIDQSGETINKIKNYISNESKQKINNIKDHYYSGNYEQMKNEIIEFDKFYDKLNKNFNKLINPSVIELKKFLESKFTNKKNDLKKCFSRKNESFEETDYHLNFQDSKLSEDDILSLDTDFNKNLNFLISILKLRKENRELCFKNFENFDFELFDILDTISKNINSNNELFESSLKYLPLDIANLSKSNDNIIYWKDKIRLMKMNFLIPPNLSYNTQFIINKDELQYNTNLFSKEDINFDSINKFLMTLKNCDIEELEKKLKIKVDEIKNEIIGFDIAKDTRTQLNNQREEFYETLKFNIEQISLLVNNKILSDREFLKDILKNFQEKINKIIGTLKDFTNEFNLNDNIIKDEKLNIINHIYINLQAVNNILGKLFLKNSIELKIEQEIQDVKNRMDQEITNNLDKYSNTYQNFNLQKLSDFLKVVKKYSNSLTFLKENIDSKIDKFLDKIKKAENDNIIIQKLGQLLDSDSIGKDIIDDHKIFNGYLDILYTNILKNFGIDKVLEKIECENLKLTNDDITGRNTVLDKKRLQEFHKKYSKNFDDYLRRNLNNSKEGSKFESLLNSLKLKIPKNIKHSQTKIMWNRDMITDIPEILAIISVIWTLMFSKYYFEISSYERDDKYLKMPHTSQIVAVFCLLCADSESYRIINNLIEIGTGEGKSIVLALTAAILALYGFKVSVVCYSSNLSSRDYNEFLPFFQILNISDNIYYGDFNDVGQNFINQNGDIRDLTKKIVFSNADWEKSSMTDSFRSSNSNNYLDYETSKNISSSKQNNNNNNSNKQVFDSNVNDLDGEEELDGLMPFKPNILLIDEVDVFFSKRFYGNQYIPSFKYQHEYINDLFDFIWGKRFLLLNFEKNLNYKTEKFERYTQFRKELEETKEFKKCQTLFSTCKELLNEAIKDILDDLTEYKSHPIYEIENDKIAYREQDKYVYNITYRYKTTFSYYEEFNRNKISEKSLKENISIIFNCGYFSYAEIPKKFSHIMGVSGTLSFLSNIEKETIAAEYKILRYIRMPSVFGDKSTRLSYQIDSNHIIIANDENEQMKYITDKIKLHICSSKNKLDNSEKEIKKISDGIPNKSINMMNNFPNKNYNHQLNIEKIERCVIVFFKHIQELEKFANSSYFKALNRPYKILSERASKSEIENIVRNACKSGSITLATRSFGRGIDFIVRDEAINKEGGMYVIQAFLSKKKSEEVQIMGRTARQFGTGTFNLILHQNHLIAMNIQIPENLKNDHEMDKKFKYIEEERNKFYLNDFKNNLQLLKAIKANHQKSEMFLEYLKLNNTEEVKNYIFTINKGIEQKGNYVCRTKIFLDATLSMDSLIKKTKEVIQNIFERTFEILKSYKIEENSVCIQIGVYRNYDSSENEIFECSPWESKPENLINFLKKVTCKGGWGNEAIEIPFWDILNTHPNIAQAIVIGDRRANTKKDIEDKKTSDGSFKGKFINPHEYWVKSKYANVTDCESMIGQIIQKNIKLHGFYIENQLHSAENRATTEKFFKLISEKTNGKSHKLDLSNENTGEILTELITTEILKNIAQNSDIIDKTTLEKSLLDEYKRKYKTFIY